VCPSLCHRVNNVNSEIRKKTNNNNKENVKSLLCRFKSDAAKQVQITNQETERFVFILRKYYSPTKLKKIPFFSLNVKSNFFIFLSSPFIPVLFSISFSVVTSVHNLSNSSGTTRRVCPSRGV